MIVGFGHVSRAGKSTAAQALCRDLGFAEVSFAAPLKELALKADPLVLTTPRTINTQAGKGRLAWEVKGLGWEGAKDMYPEVRIFLQNLGDGARQVFGNDFWLKQALDRMDGIKNVVVPDVRYRSEAEAIQKLGGRVFRINRPGHIAQGHASETELRDWEGWDGEFENGAGVAELERDVVTRVRALLALEPEELSLKLETS